MLAIVGAVTVRLAVAESGPAVAVITTAVFEGTATVLTVNETGAVEFAGMVTVVDADPAGGKLTGLPLGTVTVTVVSVATGLASDTVPLTAVPPTTVLALRLRDSVSGLTVSVSVDVALFGGVPVIVTVSPVATKFVLIVTGVADGSVVAPAGMVNGEPGMVTFDASELVTLTTYPLGAGLDSVSVAALGFPPTTDFGLTVSVRSGARTVRLADVDKGPVAAVIVTGVFDRTGTVLTVNDGEVDVVVELAGIVTVVGVKLTGEPLGALKVTVRSDAIGLLIDTVPATELPPATVDALSESESVIGFTVSIADAGEPLTGVPVTFTFSSDVTILVLIGNCWLVALAWIETDEGTGALVESELTRVTTYPLGAGLDSVSVPVAGLPPYTDEGAIDSDSTGGVTASVADCVVPLKDALIVAVTGPSTG